MDIGSEQMARLAELGAATVYEAHGQKGAIDPAIKPLDPRMRLAGRAVTVKLAPADNWFIHAALLAAGPGDVLVVDIGGFVQAGLTILVWLPFVTGHLTVPTAFGPIDWHIHEMLFGYQAAAIGADVR